VCLRKKGKVGLHSLFVVLWEMGFLLGLIVSLSMLPNVWRKRVFFGECEGHSEKARWSFFKELGTFLVF
jgi:hypothetical protein